MMESGLCGLDINPIAVHLTAAGIVGLQPETAYHDTNIGGMKLGKTKTAPAGTDDVRCGSIELLDKDSSQQHLLTYDFSQLRGSQPVEGGDINRVSAEDKSFDAVLMNPPYSGTRGGHKAYDLPGITVSDRMLLLKRDARLSKGTCRDKKAGMSTAFAAIADRKIKDGGKVGLILPLTAAAAGSFRKMRAMFEECYRDVIAAAFGGDGSISADTNMGEMTLFARKGNSGREGVGYVHIDAPLASANAGAEIARAMVGVLDKAKPGDFGPLIVGEDQVGSFYAAPPASPGSPWYGVGMESLMGFYPDAHNLITGVVSKEGIRLVAFPMTTIGELFEEVGPTHHLIGHLVGREPIGAFTIHERIPGQLGRETTHLSLWAADGGGKVTILTEPTHYGEIYRRDKTAREIARKTDLFYQRNMSWTSQKILTAVTAEPVLGGSVWAPLRGGSEITRFAFAVWANSIFGFVNHWAVGSRQHTGRTRTQIGDIRRIPCPNFTDPKLAARAEPYLERRDDLFGMELEPAVYADCDDNRRKLDLAAADILGVPAKHREKTAAWFAKHWTAEPKVRGGR